MVRLAVVGRHLEQDVEAVVPAQRGAGDVPPGPPVAAPTDDRRRARRLTALGLGLWGAAFGGAVWLVGIPTSRGSVVVWAVLAVLASRLADLRAGLRSVVVDFLPVFAAPAVHDLLRGSADDLTSVAHVDPHLTFDRVLFLGRTPTERLQDWLHHPASSAWYDDAAWAVHLSHFLLSTTLSSSCGGSAARCAASCSSGCSCCRTRRSRRTGPTRPSRPGWPPTRATWAR